MMTAGPADNGTIKSQVELSLDEIEEGRTNLQYSVNTECLDLTDVQFVIAPMAQVHLTVQRSLQTFNVKGSVVFEICGECCRCLGDVSQCLKAELSLLIQRREVESDLIDATEEDDEVEIIDPGSRVIDLLNRVRDAIALELPLRVFCRQDCKGLCSTCGQNLNESDCDCSTEQIDPRWEALAKFR